MRLSLLALLLLFCAGCASSGRQHADPGFKPQTVGKMGLYIASPSTDLRPLLSAVSRQQIARRISEAFLKAGYPVYAADATGQEGVTAYSHVLDVRVEDAQIKSTPPGFSLSIGNSDPRSPSFQKAAVIPITCSLKNSSHAELASRSGDYIADESGLLMSDREARGGEERAAAFLIDIIGSTCHELLTALGIFPAPATPSNTEAFDRPKVRVESIEEAPAAKPPSAARAEKAIEVRRPDRSQSPASHAAVRPPKNPLPAPESTDTSKPNAVYVEKEPSSSLFKKQIKIFNRGDTLILKFGHERQ